jgi:hypothetical protein
VTHVTEATPASEPDVSAAPTPSATDAGPARASIAGRRVVQIAAALIGLQLLVRGWVAASGFFWQDDLIVTGMAGVLGPLSPDFLLYDHDGHFMPAGFLLTGALTWLAPLEWWPMVVSLVVLQALASLAVWRLLRILLGDRPMLLAPLMLYLFSPLSLSAFAWWIAGVNSVPLQAGMAWVVGDAILLARTGRTRYAVTGTIAFAVTLSFFEKSLVIPLVAFAVLVLLLRHAGAGAPMLGALKQARRLWAGMAVVAAGWAAAYFSVVGSPAVDDEYAGSVPQAVDLIGGGWLKGLLPGLFGGPLTWADPGLWATPSSALVVFSCVAVAGAIVWTARHRRHCGVVWWLLAAYLVINAAAMIMGRLNEATPDLLSLSLRYYADTPLVVAIAMALVLIAPVRTDLRRRPVLTPQGRRVVAIGAAAAFLVASLWSTVTFTRAWEKSPTADYLATARASLADTGGVPLLDQGVPNTVLWALVHPYNLASHVFAPLDEGNQFGRTTSELRQLDEAGRLVDARMETMRSIQPGPLDGCGHGVSALRTTVVPLDGPLVALDWTIQLNYLAGGDGVLEVAMDGESLRVPVVEGPNTVFLRMVGGGDQLRLRGATPGVAICVDSGFVGFVEVPD